MNFGVQKQYNLQHLFEDVKYSQIHIFRKVEYKIERKSVIGLFNFFSTKNVKKYNLVLKCVLNFNDCLKHKLKSKNYEKKLFLNETVISLTHFSKLITLIYKSDFKINKLFFYELMFLIKKVHRTFQNFNLLYIFIRKKENGSKTKLKTKTFFL